jgi:hypothetical protein
MRHTHITSFSVKVSGPIIYRLFLFSAGPHLLQTEALMRPCFSMPVTEMVWN